ncbi:MAG: hypothetical protein ACJ8EB_10775 [Allosphingosinicella sp.]
MTGPGGGAILAHEPMARRTFQPVRRNSYNVGERERHLWRPVDRKEINARIQAAEHFDRERKAAGRRNGALGHVGIEVLAALYRIVDYNSGRLEPSIDWICTTIRRSRAAVVRALARLRFHGFISWIRRTEPTGIEGAGPQVRQIPNAYVFGLPADLLAYVARKLGRKPKDAVEAETRLAEARSDWLRSWGGRSLHRAIAPPLPQKTLEAFDRMRRDRSGASSPGGQNPAVGEKE